MCETCGCDNDGFKIHDPQHIHDHNHSHGDEHHHPDDHSHQRVINLNLDILSGNNLTAAMNRRFLEGRKALCLNMVSSPGSGKTTILEKTINHLIASRKLYVIEGDQQSLIDTDRIANTGATALQINTGSGCHLDAQMIESALNKLDIETNSVLFIEI